MGRGFVMSVTPSTPTYPIHSFTSRRRENHHTVNVTYTTSMNLTH